METREMSKIDTQLKLPLPDGFNPHSPKPTKTGTYLVVTSKLEPKTGKPTAQDPREMEFLWERDMKGWKTSYGEVVYGWKELNV